MIQLMKSDFQRMISQKSYLSVFLSIPFMVYLMRTQCLKANEVMGVDRQTNFNTFALYTPMHKVFSVYLFSVVVIFVVTTLASEYETGEIRMVLIRGYHSWQVLLVKYLNVLISLALFLFLYVGISYGIGMIVFPRELNISTFLSSNLITSTEAFWLTIQYYVLTFFILAVFASIVCLICVWTQSVVTATALSMFVILTSLGFYLVTQLVTPYIKIDITASEMNQFSLLLMQLKGVYQMIAGQTHLLKLGMSILGCYFVIFLGLSISLSYKRDQLI